MKHLNNHSEKHLEQFPGSLPAVEVKNLTVGYDHEEILKNLNLTIEQGTVTAIIGPNGAGKTTLLRAMLGLIPVLEGDILIFGKSIKERCRHISGHHLGCVHPGYVAQRYSFDKSFPITVEEFLTFAVPPGKDKDAVNIALKEIGMLEIKYKLLGELSGGQVQRVLIARAVLGEPKIIFLDEPEFGIDIVGEKTFYELIHYLNKNHGTTCVIVSHEIDIVYKFADLIVCLNKKMLCHGTPQKVLTAETLQKLYGEEIGLYKHRFK